MRERHLAAGQPCALGPYLVKAPDNPEVVDPSVLDGTRASIKADSPAAMMRFWDNFYSVGGEDGKRVSERVIAANWTVAVGGDENEYRFKGLRGAGRA